MFSQEGCAEEALMVHHPAGDGSTNMKDPNHQQDDVSFKVENNPFAFSPGQLNKMLNPKSLAAFHALGGINGIAQGLQTDLRAGLRDEDIEFNKTFSSGFEANQEGIGNPGRGCINTADFDCRKKIFGENGLLPPKGKPLLKLMWEAWNDKVLFLPTAAGAVSLAAGLHQTSAIRDGGSSTLRWIEGAAIMITVLIVVVVSAFNDWNTMSSNKDSRIPEPNHQKAGHEVNVIRSGKIRRISVGQILVGDVLHIDTGDLVPADGLFIDGHGVKCDESSATGESGLLKKTPASHVQDTEAACLDPFIISGSKVVEGLGTVLVTAVGEHSSLGQTMMATRDYMHSDMVLEEPMWMAPFTCFMELTDQLGDSVCGTLALGIRLLPKAWDEIEHCISTWFCIPAVNIAYSYFETQLVGAIPDIDMLDSSPPLPRSPCLITYLGGSQPGSSSLDESLLKVFWDGAVIQSRAMPMSNKFIQHDPVSTPLLWLGSRSTSTHRNLLRSRRSCISNNRKLAMGLFFTGYCIPLATAALTLTRSLRIASGVTSAVSGAAVVPLRTMEDYPVWSWVLAYGVWATAFSVYLGLQMRRIPPEANHRRQLYLFCVIMAAVHFTIALSQGSASIPDAFTLYSPSLLTASAFLMSLLLNAVFPRVPQAVTATEFEGPRAFEGDGAVGNSSGSQPDQVALAFGLAAMGGAPPEPALLYQRGNQN